MRSKFMLREITKEKAQSYSWLTFISVHFKTLSLRPSFTKQKNLFAGTKWAVLSAGQD